MSFIDTELVNKGVNYVLDSLKEIPLDEKVSNERTEKSLIPYALISGFWEGYHNDIPREFEILACKLVIYAILSDQLGTSNTTLTREEKFYKSLILADVCYYSSMEAFEEDAVKEWVECYFSVVSLIFERNTESEYLNRMCDYLESRKSWLSNGYDVRNESSNNRAEAHKKPYQMLSKVFIGYISLSHELSGHQTLFEAKTSNRFSEFVRSLFNLNEYTFTNYSTDDSLDYAQIIKENEIRGIEETSAKSSSSKYVTFLKVMMALQNPFDLMRSLKKGELKNFASNLKNVLDFLCVVEKSFIDKKYSRTNRFFKSLKTLNHGLKDVSFSYFNTHKTDTELFQEFAGQSADPIHLAPNDISDCKIYTDLAEDLASNCFRRSCLLKIYFKIIFLELLLTDASIFKKYYADSVLSFPQEGDELLKFCSSKTVQDFLDTLKLSKKTLLNTLSLDPQFGKLLSSITNKAIMKIQEKIVSGGFIKSKQELESAVQAEDMPVFNYSFPKVPSIKYGDRNIDAALKMQASIDVEEKTGGRFAKEILSKYNQLSDDTETSTKKALTWKSMPLMNLSGILPPLGSKNLQIVDFKKNTKTTVVIGDSLASYKLKILADKDAFGDFKKQNAEYYESKQAQRKAHEEERLKLRAESEKLKAAEYRASEIRTSVKRRYSGDMYDDEQPARKSTRFSNKRVGE